MRVLVTGGAGYIGGTVANALLNEGHEVIIYDNLCHARRDLIPARAEFVEGDIADRAKLEQLFEARHFDGVMHFAALIEAGESMKVPEVYFRSNTAATLSLLEAMIAKKVNRLVFSSTAALYGDPESVPIREDARLQPTNTYGESKLLVEHMLHWINQIHGLRYASLRYFNVAGAVVDATGARGEAHEPESHLIPLILDVALGLRKSIKIFGQDYPTSDGTCVRDYIHVGDLAKAHLLALRGARNPRQTHLQPRKRARFHRARGHRRGAPRHRQADRGRGASPPRRRSRRAGREFGEDHRRARLEAGISKPRRHHRQRLGLAPAAVCEKQAN